MLPLASKRQPVKVNLPHHVLEQAGKGWAQRGGEIFLEFFAGTDLGANVKTMRRKNSARHERHDNKIRKWNYLRLGALIEAGQGLCKRIPQAFSSPRCAHSLPVFSK
jgi:hypothetical protein